jgi:hypothetical protein
MHSVNAENPRRKFSFQAAKKPVTPGAEPVTLSPMQSEPITVTLSLSRETVAALWANQWCAKNKSIEKIIEEALDNEAGAIKSSIPGDVKKALEKIKELEGK